MNFSEICQEQAILLVLNQPKTTITYLVKDCRSYQDSNIVSTKCEETIYQQKRVVI